MMKEHAVIMTFPSWKWKEYGRHCMPSFDKNWPLGVQGIALCEHPDKIPYKPSDRLSILNFDKFVSPRVKKFEERNKDRDIFDLGTTGNIGIQAAKFARKALAQLYVLENPPARYVWYVDADLQTHSKVTKELLDSITNELDYVGCLPRWWKPKKTNYTETGFIVWDTQHPAHTEWCKLYASCYDNDKIFEFDAWHDCIAFDYATKTLMSQDKIKILDLGYGSKTGHPLVTGPLGKYFDHMKGKRKFVGKSHERIKAHRK